MPSDSWRFHPSSRLSEHQLEPCINERHFLELWVLTFILHFCDVCPLCRQFLVNRQGIVVYRFDPSTMQDVLKPVIEELLHEDAVRELHH